MTPTPNTPPPPHLLRALRTFYQWRRPILWATAAGTLLAVVISLLLPVYYAATTTFLALNPSQNTVDVVFGESSDRIYVYGSGDDLDRLVAIAESDQVINYMVDRFDLYGVYGIDSAETKAPLKVRREFLDNYEIIKTDQDLIEMTVLDGDPEQAAAMARAARERTNDVAITVAKATQARLADNLRVEQGSRIITLDSINSRLERLRFSSGIYNTEAQGEALSMQSSEIQTDIATTRARLAAYENNRRLRGARDSVAKLRIELQTLQSTRIALDSQLVQLNENIGPIDNLTEERMRTNVSLAYDRVRLKQYETLLATDMRALEVMEEAAVPVAKAKPIRSLIVLGGLVFSFVAAIIGVLVIEAARKYDWQSVTR